MACVELWVHVWPGHNLNHTPLVANILTADSLSKQETVAQDLSRVQLSFYRQCNCVFYFIDFCSHSASWLILVQFPPSSLFSIPIAVDISHGKASAPNAFQTVINQCALRSNLERSPLFLKSLVTVWAMWNKRNWFGERGREKERKNNSSRW